MAGDPSARDLIDRGGLILRRSAAYWRRALVVFVVGVLLAVPIVFTRPRSYRSETVILYQETIRSTDLTGGGEGTGENARRVGARLREVLLSRATLEPIIVELGLYKKQGRALDRGELIEAVDEMRKVVTFRAREGDTFEIAFVGDTPKETQEVTRRLGDCIIQEAATRRAEHAKTLKEFLDAESDRNKAELKTKEAEFAKFITLHPQLANRLQGLQPELGPGGKVALQGGGGTSGDPILNSLEGRAARIDRQLRIASKAEPAAPPKPLPAFVPPPDSPELNAARKDLADKQARYTEKHPDVIAAKNRLRVAEAAQVGINQAALDDFAAKTAAARAQAANDNPPPPKNANDEAALRGELMQIQAQMAARRAQLGDAGAEPAVAATDTGGLELEFRRLQREVAEAREHQHQIDERLFKASITASSVMNDRNIQVSILDPAFLPIAPVSKSRTVLLSILLLICMVLAVATAVLSSRLDDRIHDVEDLERIDILPVLGTIPRESVSALRRSPVVKLPPGNS